MKNKSIIIFKTSVLIAFFLLSPSCKKEKTNLPQTGTVTDMEGNVYKTVKIGTQEWMAEDLKVSKYRNGTAIQEIAADTAQWKNDTFGAYCAGPLGKLYNWYAIHTAESKIAPEGWHIPTDAEWKVLEQHLGMSAIDAGKVNFRGTQEGEKLKMTGVDNWTRYREVWATNESGFCALAGNCRLFNGKGGDPVGAGYMGFWWTATEDSLSHEVWYRYLDYKNTGVFRYHGPKSYGFSVRCVKD